MQIIFELKTNCEKKIAPGAFVPGCAREILKCMCKNRGAQPWGNRSFFSKILRLQTILNFFVLFFCLGGWQRFHTRTLKI
jgi:hypothetical protein